MLMHTCPECGASCDCADGVLARERIAVLAFVDAFAAWWATDPEVGINEEPDDLLRRFLATRRTGPKDPA